MSTAVAKTGAPKASKTLTFKDVCDRIALQAHVMQLLHRDLMHPEVLEAFLESMRTEYQHVANELRMNAAAGQRERAALDRKIANLVDAISDGRSSPAFWRSWRNSKVPGRRAATRRNTSATRRPHSIPRWQRHTRAGSLH